MLSHAETRRDALVQVGRPGCGGPTSPAPPRGGRCAAERSFWEKAAPARLLLSAALSNTDGHVRGLRRNRHGDHVAPTEIPGIHGPVSRAEQDMAFRPRRPSNGRVVGEEMRARQ